MDFFAVLLFSVLDFIRRKKEEIKFMLDYRKHRPKKVLYVKFIFLENVEVIYLK